MNESKISEKTFSGVDKIKPFVLSIPNNGNIHNEILNSSQGVEMRSGLVTLQPGQECGSHNTGNNEELLVILEGSGEVKLDGFGIEKIQQGCAAYIPPITQHNVFNNGKQVLQYIYVVSKVGEI
jgi:mannose-6-phosphate isomerase-like protein (cupin superfamily)